MINFREDVVYFCATCRAVGLKLWRPYNPMGPATLWCATCLLPRQAKADAELRGTNAEILIALDDDGLFTFGARMFIDQLGGMIPAIPCADGSAYWGYTSGKPFADVEWWKARPTYTDVARELRCRINEAKNLRELRYSLEMDLHKLHEKVRELGAV